MSVMNSIVEARGGAVYDLGFAIRGVAAAAGSRRRLRRDVAQLMRLDARMLDDIGLSPGDLTRRGIRWL